MQVFKFSPVKENLGHRDWNASTHRDICHVAAKCEADAINFVSSAFFKASERIDGYVLKSPWKQEELVACTSIADFSPEPLPEGLITEPDGSNYIVDPNAGIKPYDPKLY